MTIATAFTCMLPQLLGAQVRVDGGIRLVGQDPSDRRVSGLAPSTNAADALSAGVEQAGTYRLANSVSGSDWTMEVAGLDGAPDLGTQLVVRAPGTVPGPVAITINGHGPYPVTYGPDEALDGASVTAGAIFSVVFDGSAFQVLNGPVHSLRDCPTGMVAMNDGLCIDQVEHPAGNRDFFAAIELCADQGRRLCSWGEWYVACVNGPALGVQAMTGNWEWTNDAGNSDGQARWVGNSSCTTAGVSATTVTTRFRCCYSR
ncbi:MAG: hypothetical protein KDB84_08610 [Flavobacteriales bacterium]|nr:hypothetical protein [Flavobacteriales bacterium]